MFKTHNCDSDREQPHKQHGLDYGRKIPDSVYETWERIEQVIFVQPRNKLVEHIYGKKMGSADILSIRP